MTSVHIVIPSLSATTDKLSQFAEAASHAGASYVIVSNSATLTKTLASAGIRYVTTRNNAGFAASINLGAKQSDWDWLVILNDDIDFDPGNMARALRSLHAISGNPAIVQLDAAAERPIPGIRSTLGNVSLSSAMYRKLWKPPSRARREGSTYRSFSAVAVRRECWEALGGLDERYAFTFEDSDFARRMPGDALWVASDPAVAVHSHSVTTSRWIAEVLPVASFSALEYLGRWYGHRSAMRVALLFALVARVPLALLRPRRRQHLLGIARSLKHVAVDSRPALPMWEEI